MEKQFLRYANPDPTEAAAAGSQWIKVRQER
ncbi:hypothetical protein AVEN_38627-1, partial [Araneus ventricosus]